MHAEECRSNLINFIPVVLGYLGGEACIAYIDIVKAIGRLQALRLELLSSNIIYYQKRKRSINPYGVECHPLEEICACVDFWPFGEYCRSIFFLI